MTPTQDHLWAGDWQPAVDEPTATHQEAGAAGPGAHQGAGPPGARAPIARHLAAGAAVLALGAGAFGLATRGGDATTAPDVRPLAVSTQAAPATDVGRVYAKASPAVVSVRTGSGQGTGFLIDSDGTIVTNAHVVGDATSVDIRFGEDGERTTGRVLGRDPSSDLAVVQVPAAATRGVTPLQLADSRTVKVGDQVVAIGNPFGLDRTATAGIVSATGRSIEAPNGFSISDAIQTDAPINPGNSGGPLLDGAGRVIGVNSQIATSGAGGGNVGVGFAVPTSLVRTVVPALKAGKSVERPYLGISTGANPAGGAVQIAEVTSGGPADTAGLRAGDELVSVDGSATDSPEDVSAAIADRSPGDQIEVVVRRGGAEQTMDVRLGNRPTEAP